MPAAYPEEFRRRAVSLVVDEGVPAARVAKWCGATETRGKGSTGALGIRNVGALDHLVVPHSNTVGLAARRVKSLPVW